MLTTDLLTLLINCKSCKTLPPPRYVLLEGQSNTLVSVMIHIAQPQAKLQQCLHKRDREREGERQREKNKRKRVTLLLMVTDQEQSLI